MKVSLQKYRSLLIFALLVPGILAANFDECRKKVEDVIEGRIKNDTSFDIRYYGPIRNFDPDKAARPATILTYEGCVEMCGSSPNRYEDVRIIQIITTWVLPSIALLSQLPYESLSYRRRRNAEAFFNWIGAPASAMTAAIFNILLLRKLVGASERGQKELSHVRQDVYYVLSCLNQYNYESSLDGAQWQNEIDRDVALYYGLFRPLGTDERPDVQRTRTLIAGLAFRLRTYRRRGVWPVVINVMWFFAAFIISIVLAFADLGDNITAHSLALGLLLSWLPTLVVVMIVDRNPVSSTHCKVLIERWLFRVHQVRCGPDGPNTVEELDSKMPKDSHLPFKIGDFVGQGRVNCYCGVANAVMKLREKSTNTDLSPESHPGQAVVNEARVGFSDLLLHRPLVWWFSWVLAQSIVGIAFGMALLVSYMTPTVGLGCRSISYILFFVLTSVSWLSLSINGLLSLRVKLLLWLKNQPLWKTLSKLGRSFVLFCNILAVGALAAITVSQAAGFFNTCRCKSNAFPGVSLGGYMDFENAEFYKEAYGVVIPWGVAAAIGPFAFLVAFAWTMIRWSKSKALWKFDELNEPGGDD